MTDALIAQLRDEIAQTRASVAFWEAQPEAGATGFSAADYRQVLVSALTQQEAALALLEESNA